MSQITEYKVECLNELDHVWRLTGNPPVGNQAKAEHEAEYWRNLGTQARVVTRTVTPWKPVT